MRIIKRGKKNELKERQATCSRCKTVFAYNNNDIKGDQRDGDYVECPECKSFIAAERIPEYE